VTIRTREKTVTFGNPFFLGGLEERQPAGVYTVETDEELLQGVSTLAYRRVLTLIHLHAKPGRPGVRETLTIDPNELEAALKRDKAPIERPADPGHGQATKKEIPDSP